jgi:hypothetical protein
VKLSLLVELELILVLLFGGEIRLLPELGLALFDVNFMGEDHLDLCKLKDVVLILLRVDSKQ